MAAHRTRASIAVITGSVLAAASGVLAANAPARTAASPSTTSIPPIEAGTATAALVRPDPVLHPGKIKTGETKTVLCARTFKTSSVRPPTSYTNRLKVLELGGGGDIKAPSGKTYHVTGEHLPGAVADYELDHLISLEIGGNPEDPKNLWMEPWARKGAKLAPDNLGAETKDVTENRLHREVCNGNETLRAAQTAIAADWTTAA